MPIALPFLPLPQTDAVWPVWSDSTTQTVRFQPMPKKAAVRLWHRARDFDRGTHEPGRHGGAVGPTALQVLHALIFDFLNHRTGRLDPSYEAIARQAGVCVRAVATALARLRANTLFTQIPGVVAGVPAGNVPSVGTAQQTGPIDNRSSHSRWLSPPIFTMPGMARH